ncbi:MAG: DUF4965 domain-containing protein, partial [Bacteroidales bacterium]|nr:DUF4965 domain-containing protein [Bacteroidales bacterium]
KKRLKQKCYVDYGLVKEKPSQIATQTGYKVTATQSEFNFTCGGINLDVTFTAPMLMDNLDVMTRPANYISYQVKSSDGKKHDVAIYFDASSQMCVFKGEQEIEWESKDVGDMTLLKAGTVEQPILEKEGDDRLIDWGHLLFAAKKTPNTSFSIAPIATMHTSFIKEGKLPAMDTQMPRPSNKKRVGLAVVNNLGEVNAETRNGYVILGYDDIYSIEYFGDHLRAWWKRNDMSTEEMILAADKEYAQLMNSCKTFDEQLYTRAEQAGGKNYAELCVLSYRQAISAHKLVADKNGTPLFFSKENYSNGSIGTVDVTYPSVPLFLLYNTTLVKGMLEPIFYYSESGKWTKNIAAHDVGKYPKANGQKYEEDMPVEECGNMLIMTNAICAMDKDYSYAKSHWETITIWANYLKEKGFDPDNQLCTDDFAGHLAHNSNLSIKAIVALGCYAQMAEKLNMPDESKQTYNMAKAMAAQWMEAAKDSGRYSLTFDKKGIWSQKYNLVWDKMLGLNLFPESVIRTELDWYKTVQNEFGLPLDSRADYTKSDWILWTAVMADTMEEFQFFVDPVYRFANETH